jgi:hypothetical protein
LTVVADGMDSSRASSGPGIAELYSAFGAFAEVCRVQLGDPSGQPRALIYNGAVGARAV